MTGVGMIEDSTPGGKPGIVFWTGTAFDQNRFNLYNAATYFRLSYNADGATGALNIIQGGKVGVGVTSSSYMFEVGGTTKVTELTSGNIYPITDNTYYVGKNDDDTPLAWKGVILKDTTDGKYYRIEVISGTVTATDLTD